MMACGVARAVVIGLMLGSAAVLSSTNGNAAQQQRTVTFASLFTGDGAVVLQKGVPVSVWGNSTLVPAGASVILALDGVRVASAAIDGAGGWRGQLPAQPAAWSRRLSVKLGTRTAPRVHTCARSRPATPVVSPHSSLVRVGASCC